ncbi:dnaJ domain-containing protein [Ditylenchus destructor]|uniref:DnaJ domain-containing protein n=1 Tax=Ditylenchus destructor TaxID=166010 RepID=A0AAD4MHI4_9BILA|nr:dnaJ domain-containing protein [Ditylenchus destructor]
MLNKFTTHFIQIIALLCSILKAISGEPICEYEKETQLPEQTEDRAQALDHRPIAKSRDGLISEWRKKPELNLKPGDIIQFREHQDIALYLGKGVAHIFGDKFRNYDVLIHMEDDWNGSAHVGCKVTNYRDEKHNYEHFFHLIKHSRLESIIENDSKNIMRRAIQKRAGPQELPQTQHQQARQRKRKTTWKKQFRRLALKYHPDKNLENQEEMRPKFEAITAAQKILLDHEIRLEYDRCLCLVIENKSTVADLRRKKMYKTLKVCPIMLRSNYANIRPATLFVDDQHRPATPPALTAGTAGEVAGRCWSSTESVAGRICRVNAWSMSCMFC